MWRLISSGSWSEIEEPSSTLPMRVTAPESKSAASTSEVFPEPTMRDHGDVANLFRAIDVHKGCCPFFACEQDRRVCPICIPPILQPDAGLRVERR